MNVIQAVFLSNALLAVMIGALTWKTWLGIIKPDWFVIYRIFGTDMLRYSEHKMFVALSGKRDSYDIDRCNYDKSGVKPYISPDGIDTWNFVSGQNKPIIFRQSESEEGKLIYEAKKSTLDDIWFGSNDFLDFIKTWGVFIVGGIIVVMVGYMISQNQKSTELTTQLLINMTRNLR